MRGFTLIEITVALVVGGMALTAAAALYQGLGGRAEAIQFAGRRVDRDANAERLLRDLWANLRFGADSSASVRGDSASLAFNAWCRTSEGWMRPCSGRLFIEREDAGFAIRLGMDDRSEPPSPPLTLWTGLPAAGFRFLRDAAGGGSWRSRWSDLVIPPAIAVVAGSDTLMVAAW